MLPATAAPAIKGNSMQSALAAVAALALSATHAGTISTPTRFFYRDPGALKVSFNEPATGCQMRGLLLHPVEKPAAKVMWISERVCGQKTQAVSMVSGEIDAPDNIIHKGQKLDLQSVQVNIVEAGVL